MHKFVEIRAYNLECGTRAEFDRLMRETCVPLLRQWQVDVVAFHASPHDDTSYYLIRAYDSLDQRLQSQDAFYSSIDWKSGPREAVLALIEHYTSVVIEMDEAMVTGLRSVA